MDLDDLISDDSTTYTEFINRQTPWKILILKLLFIITIAGIIIALIFT